MPVGTFCWISRLYCTCLIFWMMKIASLLALYVLEVYRWTLNLIFEQKQFVLYLSWQFREIVAFFSRTGIAPPKVYFNCLSGQVTYVCSILPHSKLFLKLSVLENPRSPCLGVFAWLKTCLFCKAWIWSIIRGIYNFWPKYGLNKDCHLGGQVFWDYFVVLPLS